MDDDHVDEMVTAEPVEVEETRMPFREHPLFVDVERQLAEGEDEGAATNLKKLIKLYPEEETIRDLEMRAALRSTFSVADSLPVRRGKPGAMLRALLVFLVVIAVCLTASAGFGFAYEQIVVPNQEMHERQLYITGLWQDADLFLGKGDLIEAREVLETLAVELPGDGEVEAAFLVLAEQESLMQMYNGALDREAAGDLAGALDLLHQLEEKSPGYLDIRQRMVQLERAIELARSWEEAQRLADAEDWQNALPLLTKIRQNSPGFHRTEVNEYLFRAYSTFARQLLDGARGEIGQMEQAIGYMEEALRLRPGALDLAQERRLARWYVAGAKAYVEENWLEAVRQWEPVYRARPDYQGGVVDTYLYHAYPRAAAELVVGAKGAADPLEQAIGYFDQVLMRSTDDAAVVEERYLAVEYLAGLEAFNDEQWDQAIVHWGPIYLMRTSYQDGVLEEQLRIACAAAEIEYDNWCSP